MCIRDSFITLSGRGRAQQNAPAPGTGAPPQQQQSAPPQVGRGRARGGQPPAQSAPRQQPPMQQAPSRQQQQVADTAEQMARMNVKEERPRQRRGIGEFDSFNSVPRIICLIMWKPLFLQKSLIFVMS